jgi:hypothetical protein
MRATAIEAEREGPREAPTCVAAASTGVLGAPPTLNPCAAKTLNPCAAKTLNPCKAKSPNPCGAKLNPCGAGANPCGGDRIEPARFKQRAGVRLSSAPKGELLAVGEKLWNDRMLGKTGLACATCHFESYAQMQPTFACPPLWRALAPGRGARPRGRGRGKPCAWNLLPHFYGRRRARVTVPGGNGPAATARIP